MKIELPADTFDQAVRSGAITIDTLGVMTIDLTRVRVVRVHGTVRTHIKDAQSVPVSIWSASEKFAR